MLQQSKRLCDTQRSGRSAHDESLFHMAERIPEGVENAIPEEARVKIETASRGSNRVVANSNDHEVRLDADGVQS